MSDYSPPGQVFDLESWRQKVSSHLGIEVVFAIRDKAVMNNVDFSEISGNGISFSVYEVKEAPETLAAKKTLNIPFNLGYYIASFKLIQLPGCCGICVSTGNYIHEAYRGKKLNNLLNQFRIAVAEHCGYTVLLCTDKATNASQKATLARNGWKDIYQFKNNKTQNLVDISVVQLNPTQNDYSES